MPIAPGLSCPIHYEIAGTGEPLVLIPGLGQTSQCWGYLLERLSPHFRCILIDNRCSGKSGSVSPFFTISAMADDVQSVLEDAGIRSAHILGNSLGGMVAQAFALRHPESVTTLTLLSTSPGVAGFPCHPSVFASGVKALRDRWRGRPVAGAPKAEGEGKWHASLGHFLATITWAGLPWLHRIAAPTLVIHGTHDRVIPVLNAHLMARTIPGAQLLLLHGAGHLVMRKDEVKIADAILQFLQGRPVQRAWLRDSGRWASAPLQSIPVQAQ